MPIHIISARTEGSYMILDWSDGSETFIDLLAGETVMHTTA
jgi:hypothetical protein